MDSLSSVERRDQTYVARARAPLIKSAVTCAESQRDRHIRMCDGVLPTLFFFLFFFFFNFDSSSIRWRAAFSLGEGAK